MKDKQSFDTLWRFEALKLAAMEMLEIQGILDSKLLFRRAKDIYNQGYQYKIDTWRSYWKENDKTVKEIATTEPPKEAIPEVQKDKINGMGATKNDTASVFGMSKTCPLCDEIVPASWRKHIYKIDGTRCGYGWSNE